MLESRSLKMAHGPRHLYSKHRSLMLLAACLVFYSNLSAQPNAPAQPAAISHMHELVIDVNQGWRIQDGDDPAYSRAGFDDSAWDLFSLDQLGGAQPGWRWYRTSLILPEEREPFALLINGGDGVYEVYANGVRLTGPAVLPALLVTRPIERVMPLDGIYLGRDRMLVLALRTHAPLSYIAWHNPILLSVDVGTPSAIENERQALEGARIDAAGPSVAINLLVIAAGLVAFALHRAQRRREYLWLGAYLSLLGLSNLLQFVTIAGFAPQSCNQLLGDPMIYLVTIAQIQFTFSFAGRRVGRFWRIYECLLLTPLIFVGLVWSNRFRTDIYVLGEAAVIFPAAILLPVLLLLWYRRGNREAGWLILPSLLPAATAGLYDIGSAAIYFDWPRLEVLASALQIGPIPLQIADIGDLLLVIAIGIVMFFRFTRASREQARAVAELEAGREIQAFLIPASLPASPGYRIEAAYLPAAEVGGDFYQALEQTGDATLIIVGDVSGKGLRAAMTVAVALGVLRALAVEGLGPAAMLARLNQQMVSAQETGFITCICMRISALGEITIANAGHLAPYRNGEELEVDSGLPIGIMALAEYCEQAWTLAAGDTLTLMSDGVVEARSESGELFGFERTRQISKQPARAIAEAALHFGQEDDITVVRLTFAGSEHSS